MNQTNQTNQTDQMNQINGLLISGLFLFNILDRLFERPDKGLRLSQGILSQLELRDQHASLVDNDQPIALFHTTPSFDLMQCGHEPSIVGNGFYSG